MRDWRFLGHEVLGRGARCGILRREGEGDGGGDGVW